MFCHYGQVAGEEWAMWVGWRAILSNSYLNPKIIKIVAKASQRRGLSAGERGVLDVMAAAQHEHRLGSEAIGEESRGQFQSTYCVFDPWGNAVSYDLIAPSRLYISSTPMS